MFKAAYQSYRPILPMLLASSALLGLVGYASNETIGLFGVSILTVIILMLSFHYLFGKSTTFFNVVFANAITLYLCFFTFFVDSLFTSVPKNILPIGFALPPIGFLLGTLAYHKDIKDIITAQKLGSDTEFLHSFMWLLPIIVIGLAAFMLHQMYSFDVVILSKLFVIEMGVIAFIVFLASKDFSLLLMDTGMLFSDFFSSNLKLIKPAFAFFTFYSMNIVIFSALYRILDYLSVNANFAVQGVQRDLTFVESLYFSLVTISTLGYGDIIPLSNAVRFIVGLQSLFGTIFFFFGVHAILSHKKN